MEQTFSLIPFPALSLPAVTINGIVSLQDRLLALHYSLAGNIADVLLPNASQNPGRKDELWKATCFEFFLAVKDQPGYWEFNISPSGDWNVYRMDAYRRVGFQEEMAVEKLPFVCKKELGEYSLDVSLDLTPILRSEQELQMAITAIIQMKDGNETYWALAHPAPYADFHLREGFILSPAVQSHLFE